MQKLVLAGITKSLDRDRNATILNASFTLHTYKGITNISYNHLNLPTKIEWGTTKSIEFVYTASGEKVEKTVKTGSTINYIQNYIEGVEYNGVSTSSRRIESIYHNEGRFFNTNTATTAPTYRTEYTIKDHLGNARVTFADKNNNNIIDVTNSISTNEIIQENHYYAFGLNHEGTWLMNEAGKDNCYQYNGKELNGDHGLNWNDYGARWYDPSIGRFGTIDRFSEKYVSMNPYQYGANNPIKFIDVNGDSLRFYGSTEDLKQVSQVLNNGINKTDVFSIGEDGKLNINPLTKEEISKLDDGQKELYNGMSEIHSKTDFVNIGVVSGSETIPIGSFNLEKIDIGDIKEFGNGQGANSASVLGHEIKEQALKQLEGKDYPSSHSGGKDFESKITGYTRGKDEKQSNFSMNGSRTIINGTITTFYSNSKNTIKVNTTFKNNNISKVTRN
jgi:RHS repeat-associated protein